MQRKWEYIMKTLEGLTEVHPLIEQCVGLAERIDRVLLDLYGDIHTEGWIKIYNYLIEEEPKHDVKWILIMIEELATSRLSCVACTIHDNNCYACRFGYKCGLCQFDDSIFHRFLMGLRIATHEYIITKESE